MSKISLRQKYSVSCNFWLNEFDNVSRETPSREQEWQFFVVFSSLIKITAAAVMSASLNAAPAIDQHFLLPPRPLPAKAPPMHLHRDGKHAGPSRPSHHLFITLWSELLFKKACVWIGWQTRQPDQSVTPVQGVSQGKLV